MNYKNTEGKYEGKSLKSVIGMINFNNLNYGRKTESIK